MSKIKIELELSLGDPRTQEVIAALNKVLGDAEPQEAVAELPNVAETTVTKDDAPKGKPKGKAKANAGDWTPGGGDVEEKSIELTVDDVRKVVAEARRSNKATAEQLKDILKENGASNVSGLKPERYAAVIDAVAAL